MKKLFECIGVVKHENDAGLVRVSLESTRNRIERVLILAPRLADPGDTKFIVGDEYIVTIEEAEDEEAKDQ